MPCSRKRQLDIEAEPTTDSSPPPTAKRPKLEKEQRHKTPSGFWDNLSRQWLTPRALREFDRRAESPAAALPPGWTDKEDIDLAQLKRFARHGGPSLEHLRAYPEPETAVPSHRTMSSSQSGPRKRNKTGGESDIPSKTKKSSAYDPAFEQHLIDHGIYPDGHDDDDDDGSVYPDNWEETNERLAQRRRSLSPSRFPPAAFLNFKKKNKQALTEDSVMSEAFPLIAGTSDIPSQKNLLFGNLKPLTDGSLTKAKPDFWDGSRPADLNKQIREELGPYIVPSTNTAAPCLPNFFTEGKGPSGSGAVCMRQALYDGALGARGIHELRSYVDPETAYDNNAYTITSTYHDGVLRLYTIHSTRSTNSKRNYEFRMTQLNGWAMTGNPDTFRQGASALRNARDWAKEKRAELIIAANSKCDYEFRMTKLRGWDMTGDPDTFRQGASALRNARDWAKEKRAELMIAANGKVPDAENSDLVSSTQSFVRSSSNEATHPESETPESETSTDELALDVGTLTTELRSEPKRMFHPKSPRVDNPYKRLKS